jgi:hypothetical protein
MRGEWKLLTEWERPLMPVEVLKTLPSGALGRDDSDRVSAAGGGGGVTGRRRGGSRRFGEER